MNADRLLARYQHVVDAPDAVGSLRCFILSLAVRGKLVPQVESEEPASNLLKRIALEKTKLLKSGELRKPRNLDSGKELCKPFVIPNTWRWVRLDAIGAIVGGGTPSAADPDNFTESGQGVPWLTPADLGGYSDLFIERGSRDLTEKGLRTSSATVMPKGTVLFTSRAPIGYVAIAANPISTNQGFKSIVPYITDCSRFIATAMMAFAPEIDASAPGTTFKEVSGKIVAAISFPLPPLTEQHRIVSKVDELMGLCDQLEAAQAVREAVRDRLAATSLARLNAPQTAIPSAAVSTSCPPPNVLFRTAAPAVIGGSSSEAGSAFANHALFVLDALSALTARPDQIKALRQTILNLAIQGKLMPQDAKDEPASELLKHIAKTRQASGKRHKELPEISANELDKLPQGWCAAPLIALGDWAIGSGFPKNEQGEVKGSYFFLKVSDMNLPGNEKFITTANNFIDDAAVKRMRAAIHSPGTIIFPKIGGAIATNKRRILNHFSAIDNNCLGITFSSNIDTEWAYLLMLTFDFTRYQVGTAVPALQQGTLAVIPVAVPPLAEQHRIVAKVDALMALCDRLEASLTATAATRRRLLDALLAEALAPAEDHELEAAE